MPEFEPRKRVVEERLVKRGQDERAFNREFWARQPGEAKFAAVWEMVVESHLFGGKDAGELRFQRSVESLRKRRS